MVAKKHVLPFSWCFLCEAALEDLVKAAVGGETRLDPEVYRRGSGSDAVR